MNQYERYKMKKFIPNCQLLRKYLKNMLRNKDIDIYCQFIIKFTQFRNYDKYKRWMVDVVDRFQFIFFFLAMNKFSIYVPYAYFNKLLNILIKNDLRKKQNFINFIYYR